MTGWSMHYWKPASCLSLHSITGNLPQALHDKGGWATRATVDAYVRYVEATVKRMGDRVKQGMTHNEPWCVSILSHQIGEHAPGLRD